MSTDTAPKPGSSLSPEEVQDESDDDQEKDDLTKEFEAAAARLRSLTDVVDSNLLIYLYARYKQSIDGPCNAPRPGLFDFRGKLKWEAWKALGAMDRRQSMMEYVEKIREIDPQWNVQGSIDKVKEKSGFGVGISRPVVLDDESESGGVEWLDAVKEGNLDLVKALSLTDPTLIKGADENGMSALHWASDRGHSNLVQWLVRDVGLDVNTRDENGQTALHFAYACGHEKVIRTLMDLGAEKLVDNDGNRPDDLCDN